MTQSIPRLLPQSPDAEKGLICSFLLCPREVGDYCIAQRLTPDQLHIPAHAEMLRALLELHAAQKPIDFIILIDLLRERGRLEHCGGAAAVTELFTYLPTAANAAHYAEIVQEKHTLREIIRVCTDHAARAYAEQDDVPHTIERVQKSLIALTQLAEGRKKAATIHELVHQSIAAIEAAQQAGTGMKGLPTGLRDLDDYTGGMAPSEYIVIQAKRSDGKTALAMNIAAHLALDHAIPVGIISLEMAGPALTTRLIASRAQVNGEDLLRGKLTKGDSLLDQRDPFAAVAKAATEIAQSPLYIEDEGNLGILEISAKLRRLYTQHGIRLAVIDYVQLMREEDRGEDKRHDRIAANSKGIKNLAKELGIPIIALCQVNADGDVAGSKEIWNDADQCWAIWPEGDDFSIRIIKQRNGARGDDIEVHFDKPTTTFKNADQKPTRPAAPAPGKKRAR